MYALLEALEALEGAAASLAAKNAREDDISVLNSLLADEPNHFDNPATLSKLHQQLHAVICDAARNRYLTEAIGRLSSHLSLLQGPTVIPIHRLPCGHAEHGKIIEAISARNPDAAEKYAREHMKECGRTRIDLLLPEFARR